MNKLPSLKICPYCSKTVTKLTKDHIVSRGLFIKPYPENLPTVRVCEECNRTKGGNEDYFRDFRVSAKVRGLGQNFHTGQSRPKP